MGQVGRLLGTTRTPSPNAVHQDQASPEARPPRWRRLPAAAGAVESAKCGRADLPAIASLQRTLGNSGFQKLLHATSERRSLQRFTRDPGGSPSGGAAATSTCPAAPPALPTPARVAPEPEPPEKSADLDAIAARYRDMIRFAREHGYDVCADNLEHFLAGSGATRSVSVAWLRGFGPVTAAERRNQGRFEDQLREAAGRIGHGDQLEICDYWDARVTGSITSELFYASGTSQLRSVGTFTVSQIENELSIHGSVEHIWFDPYDWNKGQSAYIPGFGSISDDDGIAMQRNRGARSYLLESRWTQRLSGRITKNEWWFDDESFSWSGP